MARGKPSFQHTMGPEASQKELPQQEQGIIRKLVIANQELVKQVITLTGITTTLT